MIKPLLDEVERLREVMKQHHGYLSKTESATRYALIDPVLKLLGWDVHDAHSVLAEYRAGAASVNFVDYALMAAGAPATLIEAKSLGANLALKELEQLSNYCVNCQPKPVRWGILTNGDQWQLVDAHNIMVPLQDRIVLQFAISAGTALAALNQLVSLFGLVAGHINALAVPKATTPLPAAETQPTKSLPHRVDGLSLLADLVVSGSKVPASIQFPNGDQVQVSSWASVLKSVGLWLVASARLSAEQCPVPDAGGKKRFIVNTSPVHKDGASFKNAHQLGGGILLESNYSAGSCVTNALHLLKVCGVDPDTVRWTP
ncbi:MAG: hypothetical protein HZB16_13325 [Armatimonadetes bacterium]|nr:hypothetical protein [Armatimonadota bacterium]